MKALQTHATLKESKRCVYIPCNSMIQSTRLNLSALLDAVARRLPLGTKNLRYPCSRSGFAKLKCVLQTRGPASCQHSGVQDTMASGIYWLRPILRVKGLGFAVLVHLDAGTWMSDLAVGLHNEASDQIFISRVSKYSSARMLPVQGRFHCTHHEIVYDVPIRNQVSFPGSTLPIER